MSEATPRELRRQIRHWRRGRADARLVDVIGDAYVAIFSTLILGSMLVSVLVNTGALTARSCSAGPCQSARFWGPWLVTLGVVTVAGALARLFGPVFVSSATASWLLSTPVRRRSLLVGPLVLILVIAAGLVGAATLVATAVAGFGAAAVAAATLATVLLAVALVGLWTLLQEAGAPGIVATALVWLPGLAFEAALLLTWHDDLRPRPVPAGIDPLGWIALAALAVAAGVLVGLAARRLDRIRNRDLSAGGELGAALSGALATLDLALVYDVVAGQRWRRRGQVRSRRGGPRGLAALIWLDLVRLWRSPTRLAFVLAAVPVTYAAQALGAGKGTAVIAVLAGFAAGVPLLIGVRVLSRTPGLARMLPFPTAQARAAALVVPGCCLLGYGVLVIAATPEPVPIALGSLAAAMRWVTGRPPDYGRPLLSTPAGGVPANLYGSALRGFDIALLTGLPLLLPGGNGATISMAVSAVVLLILINRRAG